MNSKNLIIFLFVVIFLSGCSQTGWIKTDSETPKPDLNSASILFPHVIYYEKSGNAKIQKPGHGLFVSKNIVEVLEEMISEGKLLPKSTSLILDTMVINQWIPQHFLKSIAYYEKIDNPAEISQNEKRIFPVTPELKLLVDKVDTKYFIFVNGTALGTSDETKQFDVLQAQTYELLYDMAFSYDYQWYSLQLNIYVIDKNTNEVLWYRSNDARNAKYNPLKKGEIKSLCRKLLK